MMIMIYHDDQMISNDSSHSAENHFCSDLSTELRLVRLAVATLPVADTGLDPRTE